MRSGNSASGDSMVVEWMPWGLQCVVVEHGGEWRTTEGEARVQVMATVSVEMRAVRWWKRGGGAWLAAQGGQVRRRGLHDGDDGDGYERGREGRHMQG